METIVCHGLRASWINGWLAAVGATLLDYRIRLHWTEDSAPAAVLSANGFPPVQALASSWPNAEAVRDFPLASDWRGLPSIRRKVKVEDFATRTKAARSHPQAWTLSSTMTDLAVDRNGEIAHAPFDPPAPRGVWLHERLRTLHERVDPSEARIEESLAGRAARIQANGLGFDHTRLGSLADDTKPWVDPVIEVLAFFGLGILPVRGPGYEERAGFRGRISALQRRWSSARDETEKRFTWPAWRQPLDADGIDALLDVWKPGVKRSWGRLGIRAGWNTVQYKRRGSTSDPTRAFGSERL